MTQFVSATVAKDFLLKYFKIQAFKLSIYHHGKNY